MGEASKHRVGRVVCVSGAQVVMVIEPAARAEAGAAPAPLRKGSLVKLGAPGGALFGITAAAPDP